MAFDRTSGGHAFDFDAGVCQRCGMTREHYQDSDKPPCLGKKPEAGERLSIDDDD